MEAGGNQVAVVQLNAVHVAALAAAGLVAGEWIRRRVPLLDRLSVPSSIVGGLLYALLVLALHGRVVDFQIDTTLRDVLMLAVFTIIGFNAGVRVLRRGGVQVVLLLLLATLGAMLQNGLGMALAKLLGLNPLIGVLAGAVSLAGGPATSLAFGSTFERAGVGGAATIALASATFGITVSGLLAGWIGSWLIRRNGLKPGFDKTNPIEASREGSGLAAHVMAIAVVMGLGSIVSQAIERAGIVLPGYIGAMIVAALWAGLQPANGRSRFRISDAALAVLFDIVLPLFIVMAMLSLRLWELAALAGPMFVILTGQVVLTCALSFVVFVVLRRDFDAAVVATGYCGFMLGITANALATMSEVTRRHGPSPRAFVVVPVVGAFLIDFTNALIITVTVNLMR